MGSSEWEEENHHNSSSHSPLPIPHSPFLSWRLCQLLVNETLIPALLVKVLSPTVAVMTASRSVLPASAGSSRASIMSVPGTPGRPPSKVVVNTVSPIFNVTGLALRQPVPKMRMTFRLPSGPIEHGGSVKVIEVSGLTLPHLYTAVPLPSPVVVVIPGAAS